MLIGTAAATAGNLWTIVLGVVTLPLLVHALGTAEFGVLSLLQVCNGTTGYLSIASVGVGVAGVRHVASHAASGDDAGTARTLGALLAVGTAVGALAGLAFALAGPVMFEALLGRRPDAFGPVARWFAVSLFAEQLALSVQYGTEGLQWVALSRLGDAIRRTLTLGAATVAALLTERLEVAVAASAVVGLVWAVSLTGAVLAGRRGYPRPARPRRSDVTQLLRSGAEVGGLTAVGVGHRSMDRILAAWLFGPASVGIVEIATQVQNAASAVLSSSSYVATASAPWLETSQATSQQRALLLRGSRLVVLTTVPAVLLLGFLADPLLDVWLGAPGQRAASLVPVALLYIGMASPLQVPSNMLLGTGRVTTIIRAAFPSLVVNVVASVVLCRALGLVGLFWGTVVGSLVLAPLLFRATKAVVPVSLREFLNGAVLPAVLPAAVLSVVLGAVAVAPLPDVATLVTGGLAGGAAYAATALRRPADRAELAELVASLRQRGAAAAEEPDGG